MIITSTIFLTSAAIIGFVFKNKAENKKQIIKVDFVILNRDVAPRIIHKVNHIHNKDVIPPGVRKPVQIKNYVI